jgi:sugar-specific transcriptional regulator TrmB
LLPRRRGAGREEDRTIKRLSLQEDVADPVAAEMRKLGFTDYETRIYVRLLQESPATAYEISKATGVPRPNTYNALDALTQRNVVQPVSRDPVRYVAVAPAAVLGRIASSTREICDDLVRKLADFAEPEESRFVWTTRGEAAVHEKVRQMIREAREHIWIKAGDDVLRRHEGELRDAAARGVDMIIVLSGGDSAEAFRFGDRVRVFLHEGDGRRIGMADNLFTLIVDHAEVMTANTDGVVNGAHTRNPSIATMALGLVRHEYYLAEIFARLGPQLDAEFGPHLLKLRASCFTPEQFEAFKARLDQDG